MPALRQSHGRAESVGRKLLKKDGCLRQYGVFLGLAALVLFLDQISKAAILATLRPHEVVVVIPGFFDLVNIRNRGAAFGFLNRQDIDWQFWLFLGATLVAVWAIFAIARRARREPLLLAGLGLIMGGAAGNLVDRIRFRAVVDFLDFHWADWHWPAFNVADMGICLGVFLALIASWRKPAEAK